ncbi:hypothetical protein SUGI_1260560 [Cryptomeria japonica]|uniref:Uncharacterized protein n=1 Tax=Cryptomeria japonica TaxID=3369 RepID=A0AAD3RP41_CRYJA|nr:hypothetical protein SUGI_1260560 [Cryptomeria japonica]
MVSQSKSEIDEEDDSVPEIDKAYNALFTLERFWGYKPDFTKLLDLGSPIRDDSNSQQMVPIQTLWQTVMKVAAGIQFVNLFKTGHSQTNLGTKTPQEANIDEGDQSSSDIIPIRQLLFMTYSEGEKIVFDYFQKMATDFRKLPREWKRVLIYHRLVWNIFLIKNETKHLDGWQIQLITWIFICWEWEENINILIENWDRLRAIEGEEKPSLRKIVDHFIRNERCFIAEDNSEKDKALDNSLIKDTNAQKLEEHKKEGISKNNEDPGSSNSEPSKLETSKDQLIVPVEPQGDVFDPRNYSEALNYELPMSSLKVEMTDKLDRFGKLQEQLDRMEKLQAELKEQVDSIVKQRQVRWNEKSAEEKKLKLESWRKLKFALKRYDVSMDGIQAFQMFRFYCVAGHLPWPLPEKRVADIEDGSSKLGTQSTSWSFTDL